MTEKPPPIQVAEAYEATEFIDMRDVHHALDSGDDDALWAAGRKARSHDAFYERLRSSVGFTTHQPRGKERGSQSSRLRQHCALVMVPLVLPARLSDLIGNEAALEPSINMVRRWLDQWFAHRAESCIMSAPVGFSQICSWTPSMQRDLLGQLAIKRELCGSYTPFDFQLPPDSPCLAFIVAGMQSPMAYPSLPAGDHLEDVAFTSRIAGALEVCSDTPSRSDSLYVGLPDFASEAITDGMLRWLSEIHACNGIGRWDVDQVDQDVVTLLLEVGELPQRASPIQLRAHQLGIDGIQRILSHVAALAGTQHVAPRAH